MSMPSLLTCVTRELTWKSRRLRPYGMKQLYVRDPDGFGLCFQWKVNG
jgi:hypothetical protein